MSGPRGAGKAQTTPAFLRKVYEVVDDPSTDEQVSWSTTEEGDPCFVIWCVRWRRAGARAAGRVGVPADARVAGTCRGSARRR